MATRIATFDKQVTSNEIASAPPTAPTKIWIHVPGKNLPDWIAERMVTGEIDADGRFDIEASDAVVRVEPGFAVFESGDRVFACHPRQVQEKLASVAGKENEVVVQLTQRIESDRERKANDRIAQRQAPIAKAAGAKPLKLKAMIGSPPAPQFALVGQLQVDDSYQRSIEGGASQKLIVKIAENWDWRLCLPLIVSRRGGSLYVIDGQHRLEAAKLRGDKVFDDGAGIEAQHRRDVLAPVVGYGEMPQVGGQSGEAGEGNLFRGKAVDGSDDVIHAGAAVDFPRTDEIVMADTLLPVELSVGDPGHLRHYVVRIDHGAVFLGSF